ncbi:hypothetical protein ILP92_17140 [Maribius pontilimi]|uniref:Endonuclease III n=1 Tax=Palleronia pontilimi TaxID=1964209 RepID=A0A934MDZ8_9RHOB|nr:hypothetical protein [Palleronia pontilimi]MBJ3764463.1 hypothetical protein [Palleronia pontilimi]
MSQQDIVDALIADQGVLFSEEIGANIARDTPQELFHWLIGCLLLAARISSDLAVQAASALRAEGLHKIDGLLDADDVTVMRCLGENGYKRYDGVATDYLKSTAAIIRERYDDDLRNMLDDDADTVLARLTEAKGLGDMGAQIFAREAQLVWDVFYPRLDGPAEQAAGKLGLTTDHGALVSMAGSRERFVRLTAALTRAQLRGAGDRVEQAAD